MHKRTEVKPDGRQIVYYTFQPADTTDSGIIIAPDPTKEVHYRCECVKENCANGDTDG